MTPTNSASTQHITSVSTPASCESTSIESNLSCPIRKTTRVNLSMTWVKDENGRLFAYWS